MPIRETLEKVERDIATGDYGKARDRLHGLLSTYPDDLSLRRRLGDVYWKLQYPAMAGRYWYLEEEKTPEMVDACQAFEQSCGNNPFQISLDLKFRGDVDAIRDTFAGRTLLALQARARDEYYCHVEFGKRGAEKFVYHRRPSSSTDGSTLGCYALLAGCILSLVIALGLMLIGLVTVLGWIF